jgi:hypothetical protein
MVSLHFHNNNHPVFTQRKSNAKGRWIEESVYYWWWIVLRRSERYKKACAANGKGMKELFNDFGDVHQYEETHKGFHDWWYQKREAYGDPHNNLGGLLFGEPPMLYEPMRLEPKDIERLHNGWDQKELAVFAVPNGLPVNEAIKRFAALYTSNPKRKEPSSGRFKQVSQARYKVADTFSSSTSDRSHIENIRFSVETWDALAANPNKPKWQITFELEGQTANELRTKSFHATLGKSEKERFVLEYMKDGFTKSRKVAEQRYDALYKEDASKGNVDTATKQRCNSTFSRRLKTMRNLIEGVERGAFPITGRSNKR